MLVDKVALGRRIKAMRQNLEMTQEEFADRLNCTNSHLGKIEIAKAESALNCWFQWQICCTLQWISFCWIPMTIRNRSSCATFMSALINSL